ncbi:MAG: hypothetical protein KUA40_08690 [Desulfarculus sp.]|nr:hypothetical protein [Desulfarculus sp.]
MNLAQNLEREGLIFLYEPGRVEYTVPARTARYTPDFILPNAIIIEAKGRFETSDRHKHLLIKEQLPDLDIRFVFSNPNAKISKRSTTTYALWCKHHGFKYAARRVPTKWLEEPLNRRSADALAQWGISLPQDG